MILAGLVADRDGTLRDGWLRVEGDVVVDTGAGPGPADAQRLDGALVPGFVDGHVHGALGHDFGDCSAEEARRIVRHHAERGATTLVATLASAPMPRLEAQLRMLGPLVASGELAGLHLEGPFLALGRRGAHDAGLLLDPTPDRVASLLAAAGGALRTVTLAPELPGADDAIRTFATAGVRVQLGHTDCSAERARAALAAGAAGFTHLGNGMPPLAARGPGPIGVALADPAATLEVIADGHHLADATVDLVLTVAPRRTALVSDAMAATGLGDGDYRIAGSAVVVADGVARTTSGSLAGSTTALGDAVRALADRGVPLRDLVRAAALTPAAALGLRRDLAPGSTADLVQLLDVGRGTAIGAVLRRGAWIRPPAAGRSRNAQS